MEKVVSTLNKALRQLESQSSVPSKVKVALDPKCPPEYIHSALQWCAGTFRLDLLQTILKLHTLSRQQVLEATVKATITSGCMPTLQYLVNKYNLSLVDILKVCPDAAAQACEFGHLDTLTELACMGLTKEHVQQNKNEALAMTAEMGHLAIMKYLMHTFKLTLDDILDDNYYALRYAVVNFHHDVVEYICEMGKQHDPAQFKKHVITSNIIPTCIDFENWISLELLWSAANLVCDELVLNGKQWLVARSYINDV